MLGHEDLTYPILDKLLEPVNNSLNLNKLSSIIVYLSVVFVMMFALSLAFIRRHRCSVGPPIDTSNLFRKLVYVLLYIIILVGMVSSYRAFHYSTILILGLVASLIVLASLRQKSALTLVLVILMIFATNYRLLSSGIEEGETTSDMINIWLNGFFRWSIHGGHYDLAPLDAINKVIIAQIAGSNMYDPILGTLQYVLQGVAAFLLVYSLVKKLSGGNSSLLALVALTMLSYPYSPLLGLTVPPAPLSHIMGLMAYTLIISQIMLREMRTETIIASVPLLIYAIITHPSSLGLVLAFLVTIVAVKVSRDVNFTVARPLIYTFIIILFLYFAKALYTSFATGFVSYLQSLVSYVLNAFREEQFTFTTRNIAYSGLPRLSITAFAVFPAIVGAYTVLVLPRIIRSLMKKNLNFIDVWFILVTALYTAFSAVALLSGIGGVSQSRTVFNGVQPYIELALVLHATYTIWRERSLPIRCSHGLVYLLLIAVLSTLITPNAMPLNYSIPMAKPATLNDHVIAYMYMGLVDKDFFLDIYGSYGEVGRLVALQERGGFAYGLGSTMAVVYYYIAPRVVDAKSYWDPRIMAIFSAPKGSGYTVNRVFDAWVYGFYLYIKQ